MASGSIIEECYVCEEFIWEDEDYTLFQDRFIHSKCHKKAIKEATGMSNKQYENLCRLPQLEKDINDLKANLNYMIQYYKTEIEKIKSEISSYKNEGG